MARKGVKKQSKLAAFFSKAKPAAATYALEDQQKQPDGKGKSEGDDSEKKEEEDEARAELERLRLEKHAVSTTLSTTALAGRCSPRCVCCRWRSG